MSGMCVMAAARMYENIRLRKLGVYQDEADEMDVAQMEADAEDQEEEKKKADITEAKKAAIRDRLDKTPRLEWSAPSASCGTPARRGRPVGSSSTTPGEAARAGDAHLEKGGPAQIKRQERLIADKDVEVRVWTFFVVVHSIP